MDIGVRELRAQLADVLERVADGETVTVRRHGRPVATIAPARATPPAPPAFPSLAAFRARHALPGRQALTALLAERRAARY